MTSISKDNFPPSANLEVSCCGPVDRIPMLFLKSHQKLLKEVDGDRGTKGNACRIICPGRGRESVVSVPPKVVLAKLWSFFGLGGNTTKWYTATEKGSIVLSTPPHIGPPLRGMFKTIVGQLQYMVLATCFQGPAP